MHAAITARNLSHRFAGGHGVHDLDLTVPAGSIYGFLGPNGAGKSTTIRLLLNLLQPQQGEVTIFGERLLRGQRAPLRQVGALVESPSLYGHLSGRDNLEVTRRLLGVRSARIDEVLTVVGLADDAHRRVREYSLGMRQRLAIALALLGEPRLLILDEPSNGLDPAGIVDLRQLLRTLCHEQGLTILVSSHLLSEVEQIATHVGVLQAGRMRFEGSIQALREQVRPRLRIRCETPQRALQWLRELGAEAECTSQGELQVAIGTHDAAFVNRHLVERGIAVSHLAQDPLSLETLFFQLTATAPQELAA